MGKKATVRRGANTEPKTKLTRHWRGLFLSTLAETSNITHAAETAKIHPSRAYKLRREDPDFRKAWLTALMEGYEHLEMETLNRLRNGLGKDDNKFDIANALRLLTIHKDAVARERALRTHEDRESVLATLNAKIDAMRAQEKHARTVKASGSPNCE